ncbi:hypothetical protein HK101_007052 [Irineochytrium annulatum]|nr:hypothetical protein HK101_007052 [Irineochytrium annulatum]
MVCAAGLIYIFALNFLTHTLRVTAATGSPRSMEPLWWVIQLVVAIGVQFYGMKLFMNLVFCGAVSTAVVSSRLSIAKGFDPSYWAFLGYNVTITDSVGASISVPASSISTMQGLFPLGALGILSSLPVSQMMFLGIECLPLLTEESTDFVKDGPKAAMWSIGYFPSFMAYTKLPFKAEQVPWPMLILSAAGMIFLSLITWYEPGSQLSIGLSNSGTLYATCTYLLTALSYVRLYYKFPNIKRPWRAPYNLGLIGAIYMIIVSLISIGYMAYLEIFREAVIKFIQAHMNGGDGKVTAASGREIDAAEHVAKSWMSLHLSKVADMEALAEEDEEEEEEEERGLEMDSVRVGHSGPLKSSEMHD